MAEAHNQLADIASGIKYETGIMDDWDGKLKEIERDREKGEAVKGWQNNGGLENWEQPRPLSFFNVLYSHELMTYM